MHGTSGYQLEGRKPYLYEEVWVPALMGRCALDLVEASEMRAGDRVLDVACGTGVVAREAALRTTDVTGTDVNGAMLAAARDVARQTGMKSIRWVSSDAAAMPFDDASFDVVLCQQGLQFMPDRAAAMTEMLRVLKPEGRLALSAWKSTSPFGVALRDAIERTFGEGTTASWRATTSLTDRHALRSLAEGAGFEKCHVRYDVKIARHPDRDVFVRGVLSATPLATDIAEMQDADRSALVHEIISGFDCCMDDGGMAYPASCHTLTARKRGA